MEEKAEELEEVIYRICRVCGASKPLNEFYKDKGCKLGRASICKQCATLRCAKYRGEHKAEAAGYREEHKEGTAAYGKRYRKGRKEQIAERDRKYRLEHKAKIAKQKAKYYEAHKEEIAKRQSEYGKVHKEEIAEYVKQWRQTERGLLLGSCSSQRKRARKLEAEGDGVTPEEFKRIVKNQCNKCNMCGKRFFKLRPATMDHVVPLSKNGAHSSDNIQALCRSCNSRKNAKIMKRFIISWWVD